MLLAIAVILPTVCLLWFMSQAVTNERLAIRQKLIDSYTARGQEIFLKDLQFPVNDQNQYSAYISFDHNDNIIYPARSLQISYTPEYNIQKAWQLEYLDKKYDDAIKEYNSISVSSSILEISYDCKISVIRCLSKQDKNSEAIQKCRQFLNREPNVLQIPDVYIANAELMLINLYVKTNDSNLSAELQKLFSEVSKYKMPTESQVFILDELIKIAQQTGLAQKFTTEVVQAQKFNLAAEMSITVADFVEKENSKSQLENVFFKFPFLQPLYGIYLQKSDNKMLAVFSSDEITKFWQQKINDFNDKLVFCRIYDETGQLLAGAKSTEGELFATMNLKNNFTGWKTELYLRSGVFKEAADKKRFIYIWVTSIVIVLMISSTLLASKAVLKQAKLNKLKNDFIATITHELKTPLSSIRLFVDTLLENKCQSRQQETEYLQLISKENSRLSRLIDNFLTFSRMERNKQVFEMAQVSPVEIANSAAEALQAKFEKANVLFTTNIAKPLPIVKADKDAMTTVLVNLLDNAYKYSNQSKQIELKVYTQNSDVCFEVRDNGIGMTRRQMKKIFDRFYQVDTSLSRRAEGAGLGLSIVKFIIDAHKAKIDVESKIGKGSVFTVRLSHS